MVTIIGAGPVGLALAWKLATQGKKVMVVEEHNTIGAPVQCTGILTAEIEKYIPKKLLEKVTKTQVRKAVIHSANHTVEAPIGKDYVVDNIRYCQELKRLCTKAGARVLTGKRYVKNTGNTIIVRDIKTGKEENWTDNTLVGADGPTSTVAKHNKMYGKRRFLTGIQAVVKMKKGHYDDKIHFHPHIGEYAWYCPEGEGKARIGVAARKNARKIFDAYLKKYNCEILSMQGGAIPLFSGRNTVVNQKKRMKVILIGDAALQIKNTTGGGIVPGTKAAELLAKNPKSYEKSLRRLNKELFMHKLINKAMRRFTSKDWDKLIEQVNNKKIKKILTTTNRDNAVKMGVQLLKAKPSMILWGRKLL